MKKCKVCKIEINEKTGYKIPNNPYKVYLARCNKCHKKYMKDYYQKRKKLKKDTWF
tara:strand:+ start:1198 stop:1365 length:168 start_codon:yes stop_codon:yes gene_type:complete